MLRHLGIDLGSTSVKGCVVENGVKIKSSKAVHNANIESSSCQHHHHHPTIQSSSFHEQNPLKILQAVDVCLQSMKEYLGSICKVFVTGQMHGVMLWSEKEETLNNILSNIPDIVSLFNCKVKTNSNLITWQDQRCCNEFLNTFPQSPLFCTISTGFGIASLAWLKKYDSESFAQYNMCGTIMDFLVWLLSASRDVTTTAHNANSWGYFDIPRNCWEIDKIRQLNIDTRLLPKIVSEVKPISNVICVLYGIINIADAVIYPALGDMQCSIQSVRPCENEAVINIGTSSQISFVTQFEEDLISLLQCFPGISIVPFKENSKIVITAASLSGGNVYNNFVETLQSWMFELGCKDVPPIKDMFTKLDEGAVNYYSGDAAKEATSLSIVPTLFGERFNPSSSASISNINPSNCSLGSIVYSLFEGLVENLSRMLPREVLDKYGVSQLCVTGGLTENNIVLNHHIKAIYNLRTRVEENSDAAFGAAIFLD